MSILKNDELITILDGGMGRELQRIGAPFRQPEWSALSLIENPNMVEQAHDNFIQAGADVITTNSYALVPFHIGQDVFTKNGYDLAAKAAQIARKSASNTKRNIKVAGCIPPAFGSYKPELFIPTLAQDIWLPLIKAQENYVDFWLVETMSSMAEATAVIEIIKSQSNKPIWLSFTLDNRADPSDPIALRSGEMIDDIEKILSDINAILFNCSRPEVMNDAIYAIKAMNDTIQIGVYPNRFSEIKRSHDANSDLSTIRQDLSLEKYVEFAALWKAAGATIIGGCCGIEPDYIQALSKYFKDTSE
jgi:S-methylmethionine-dependent homocysteine/selenocysteine methylase